MLSWLIIDWEMKEMIFSRFVIGNVNIFFLGGFNNIF